MVRVLTALTAMVPAAGQLFALQWVQGGQSSKDHGDLQMFKATLNYSSGLLQYVEVGPKLLDYVVKSTSTCVDSPSGVYYFVGGKNSSIDCSWRDVNGTYHDDHCPPEYNLYGISTATGEKVSEFELPTPNVARMLTWYAMEWQLGCDQAGGVFLLGTWCCDDDDFPDKGCDPWKPLKLPLWRYDTKTQALQVLAQMDAFSYGGNNQDSFPASTYGNLAVDVEHGRVSLVFDPYKLDPDCDDCEPEGDASLTVVDTNSGNVSWQAGDWLACNPGSTECPPTITAQVYDPLKKQFFGCGFQFYPSGVVMQGMNFFYWWDETGILQRKGPTDGCYDSYATVDLSRRAAIFHLWNSALTYVSLDTGEILYQQGLPGIGGYVYLAQQNGPSPGPSPAAQYKCLDNQCQPASSGVPLDMCSTFCGSAVANLTTVV